MERSKNRLGITRKIKYALSGKIMMTYRNQDPWFHLYIENKNSHDYE